MSGSTEHLFFSREGIPTHPPMTFTTAIPPDRSISIARDALQNLPASNASSVQADLLMESSSNNSNQDHPDGDPTTRATSALTDHDETYTPDLQLVPAPISTSSGPKPPRFLPENDLPSNIQTLIDDWKTHFLSHITDEQTRIEKLLYIPPSTTRLSEFQGLYKTQHGKPCLWLHVQSRSTVTPAEYDWQNERQVLVVTSANGTPPPSLIASQRIAAPHNSQVVGGVAFYLWRGIEGFEPRPSIMKYYGDKEGKDNFLDRANRLIAEDVVDPAVRRSKRDRVRAGWKVDSDGDFSPKVARTGPRRARHSEFQGSTTPPSIARRQASSSNRRVSTGNSKLISFEVNSDYLRGIDNQGGPSRGLTPDISDMESSDPESLEISSSPRLGDQARALNGQVPHGRKAPATANGARPGPCDGCIKRPRECDRQRRCAGCKRLRKKCTYSAPTLYGEDDSTPADARGGANQVGDCHSETEDSSDADESQNQDSNAEDSDPLQYSSSEADSTDSVDEDSIDCYESMMQGCFAEHKARRASYRFLKRKYARCKKDKRELGKRVMEVGKVVRGLRKEATELREKMTELEKVHSECADIDEARWEELAALRASHSAAVLVHADEMTRAREANEQIVEEKDKVIEGLTASNEQNEAKLRVISQALETRSATG